MPVDLFWHLMRSRTDKNEEVELLNERELAILQHVAEGHTNKAIALLLEVSQRTIENHLTKIFDKLQVGSRAEAVLKARDLKVI